MPRPLTTGDYVPVHIATKGESRTHRVWPREVVEGFVKAEVIGPAGAAERPAAQRRRVKRPWQGLIFSITSMFQPLVRRGSAH